MVFSKCLLCVIRGQILLRFWVSFNPELRLIKFSAQKCVCLVLGEDGKGPVSSIDHLSRVIQSIDKISVGALATKRGFCVVGRGKFFDLPALRLARGIPHIC